MPHALVSPCLLYALALLTLAAPVASATTLLVGNTQTGNIVRYDASTGAYLGEFIPAGTGGLQQPDDLTIGPDGLLYITSGANTPTPDQGVLRFHPDTGAYIDHFTRFAPETRQPAFLRPYGCAFGPDGILYVASFRTDEILRFDGRTGIYLDTFAAGTGQPDGLNGPNDLLFTPQGQLLITTQGSVAARDGTAKIAYRHPSQILSYDPATGRHHVFATPGPADGTPGGSSSLLGLTPHPDGQSFYASDFSGRLLHFSYTGQLLHSTPTTIPGQNTGNLAYLDGHLYLPTFSPKTLDGALLRLDSNTLVFNLQNNPPAPPPPWLTDPAHLRRPIGILALPAAQKNPR